MTTSAPIHDTLIAAGLRVGDYRVPGYAGRSFRNPPRGVIVHHDVIAGQNQSSWSALLNIARYGRTDLPGPLYHTCVAAWGEIASITDGRANHAGSGSGYGFSGNADTIGICGNNAGTGAETWPMDQIESMAQCCAAWAVAFGFDETKVISHEEWSTRGKIDTNGPWSDGRDWKPMSTFRGMVAEMMEDEMAFTQDDREKLDRVHAWVVSEQRWDINPRVKALDEEVTNGGNPGMAPLVEKVAIATADEIQSRLSD